MKKIILSLLFIFTTTFLLAQNCEKGCGKITKVEPTTLKGIKPDRALLIFKFQGPGGKPAKSHIKIVVDKDTIIPVLDKNGTTKITSKEGEHKLKFKAPWWYTVKMNSVHLKSKNTYYFFIRFEAEEIGGSKPKDED